MLDYLPRVEQKLVQEFFAAFAAAEFELKVRGFVRRGREDVDYEVEKFERRRRLDIDGQPIWVISPEDLILSKLTWAKQSPSELQLRDVRAMIAVQHDLDWKYIDRWAIRLTVKALLAEVRP